MKKLILLLVAGAYGMALAQTPAPPDAKPHPPTQINSDAADFDLNSHQAVYRGHVQVVNPQVSLSCDWMVVDLPAAGGHLSHVLADEYQVEGSVTNETVTFTGNPIATTADYKILSEPLVWDRAGNKFHLHQETITPLHELNPDGGTNASTPKLF